MAYILKYQSSNGHTVILHDNSPVQGRRMMPALSHQTGLTGVDVEFASAQAGVGTTTQGYSIRDKDIVISGNIIGDAKQYAKEILRAIIPGVDGKLIYNDSIYLDVSPKQTPYIQQFDYNPEFSLVLHAPYPYWKDMNETVIPMERVVGMFELPADLTEFQLGEATYGSEGDVTNNGSVAVPVKARMFFGGYTNNPYVINANTEEYVRIEYGFTNEEVLTVDTTGINVEANGDVFGLPDEKLSYAGQYPLGDTSGCAISPDGTLLAITSEDTSALGSILTLYAISGAEIAKLDEYSIGRFGAGDCAFSPDGKVLIVCTAKAQMGSANMAAFSVDGNTLTPIDAFNSFPAGDANGCAFSSDGKTFAVAHSETPFATVYNVTGSSFAKLPAPDVIPGGGCLGCSISRDGNILVFGSQASPFLLIYDFDGSSLVKRQNPEELPPGVVSGCAISPSGELIALALRDAPHVEVYGLSVDTWVKLPAPTENPMSACTDCAFSPSGNYLVYSNSSNSFIFAYQILPGLSLARLPFDLDFGRAGKDCCFSDNGTLLAVTHEQRPGDITQDAGYFSVFHGGLIQTNLTGFVDIESTIVTLQPGKNHIKFDSDNGNDSIKGEIIIRQEHVGAWEQ